MSNIFEKNAYEKEIKTKITKIEEKNRIILNEKKI